MRTLKKCRKDSPAAGVFYISLVFSNACRVLSQCNTGLPFSRTLLIENHHVDTDSSTDLTLLPILIWHWYQYWFDTDFPFQKSLREDMTQRNTKNRFVQKCFFVQNAIREVIFAVHIVSNVQSCTCWYRLVSSKGNWGVALVKKWYTKIWYQVSWWGWKNS